MARRARGFTLIELLVGTVTTAIILTAVAATFVGVQGSYQTEARIKVAVEGMRTATDFIEQRLRMAGYGVDPRFAFDFTTAALPSATKSNYRIVLGKGLPDSITDDLAFRYRDAAWMRRGIYSAGIQLDGGTFGMGFSAGQRFIVSCVGGKDYVVVKATSAVSRTSTALSGTVDTALTPAASIGAPCLSRTGDNLPYVMLLHEMRLRIVPLDGRPFLVAFPSLDSLDTTTAVPLAADVESFQVAYVMNRPSPASTNNALAAVDASSPVKNWVLGDADSAATDRVPDPLASPAPLYTSAYEDPSRFNRHPANIRAVRLSISVRSTSPEASKRRAFARLSLEDSGEAASADGFYRTNMTTTVRVPNMMSRSAFNPPVGGEDPAGNVWGG